MGVVYVAYDPQLNRRVALKQLRQRGLDSEHAERIQLSLRREARAMARLSHPNVRSVHDIVGIDEQLYLVMELVCGGSLRAWLQAAPRRLPEIIAAFLAAGKGLQAVHRAGLLHLDFKPDNILRTDDGRVLVTDFGLSRITAAPASAKLLRAHPPEASLPRGGTLPYMAPEQFLGQAGSAWSDQFSFCVSLYEALTGSLPYPGRSPEEIRSAVLSGDPPARLAASVPASVRQVILRGLSRQPEARFADMNELLSALARDPQKRRRTLALSTLGVAVILAMGGTARWIGERPLAACRMASGQMAARSAAILQAVQARADVSPELVHHIAANLHAHTQSWQSAMLHACTAARVRHEQSDATYQLRAECLREALHELQGVEDLLSAPGMRPIERLDRALTTLNSVGRCETLRVLSRRGQLPPPTMAAQVVALRGRLAYARGLLSAGAFDRCWVLVEELLKAARGLGYRPLLAEALLLQGSLELATQAPSRGEPTLKEALWTAQAARHDEAAAQAWVKLIEVMADRKERQAEARRWSEYAGAAVERLGGDAQLSETLAALRSRLR